MTVKLEDVKAEPGKIFSPLSFTKLFGPIKDIEIHLGKPWGNDVYVTLYAIVLESGAKIYVEGEHDCPYLSSTIGEVEVPNYNEETLGSLYRQENGES